MRRKESATGIFRIQDALVRFDAGRFLRLLNGDPGTRLPTPDPDSIYGEELQNAQLWMQWRRADETARIRLLTDEWLDTGLANDGVEDPRRRDLTRTRTACGVITAFARANLRVGVAQNGPHLQFSESITVGDLMMSRGILSPQDTADRLFTLCCLSGWLRKLAKCRWPGCGRYFELKHWNRVYKRGTACCGCARVRSAVLSTSKARHEAEEALIRMIAKQFRKRIAKDPNWYRDAKLKARIMAFANSRIAGNDSLRSVYRHSLTGKWLSWAKNRGGIERVAKGSTDAES